jgi:hypothetical protein
MRISVVFTSAGISAVLAALMLVTACSSGDEVRDPVPLEVIRHPQRDRLLSSSPGVRVVDVRPELRTALPTGLGHGEQHPFCN